jgi:hypothetical protein
MAPARLSALADLFEADVIAPPAGMTFESVVRLLRDLRVAAGSDVTVSKLVNDAAFREKLLVATRLLPTAPSSDALDKVLALPDVRALGLPLPLQEDDYAWVAGGNPGGSSQPDEDAGGGEGADEDGKASEDDEDDDKDDEDDDEDDEDDEDEDEDEDSDDEDSGKHWWYVRQKLTSLESRLADLTSGVSSAVVVLQVLGAASTFGILLTVLGMWRTCSSAR